MVKPEPVFNISPSSKSLDQSGKKASASGSWSTWVSKSSLQTERPSAYSCAPPARKSVLSGSTFRSASQPVTVVTPGAVNPVRESTTVVRPGDILGVRGREWQVRGRDDHGDQVREFKFQDKLSYKILDRSSRKPPLTRNRKSCRSSNHRSQRDR